MFRVKGSDERPVGHFATGAVLVAVILALLVNLGSSILVVREYRMLATWDGDSGHVPLTDIPTLRREVFLQVVFALIMLAVLLACAATLAWFRRQYSASQQALRHVKMLAHDILASMDQGVITIDPQNTITSINSAAIRMLGIDFDRVGNPLAAVSTDSLRLAEVVKQLNERRTPIRDHDFTVSRDGRAVRFRADAHFLKDVEGRLLGSVLLLRDVTERALLEERMARMERFINLGTLASGLHHEIKNPLTALSLHVQLLEERLRSPIATEPIDDLIGVLKTEILRLNGVLEGFRDFASLQRLDVRQTDALEVVEDAVRLIRPQASAQRVQIALLHPEAELPSVPLDRQKFAQAVLNLLINALEAMPKGGILTVRMSIDEQSLAVEVADTGSGIPAELRKNLFKPYFSTKAKGTGMGLALTEKLVGQHGGHIAYDTGVKGTAFRITLPLEGQKEEV